MIRSRLLQLLVAAFLATASLCAAAATFEVAPVLLELQGPQRVASITVTNREERPQNIQVRPMAWTQERGHDVLTHTSDLQMSPPMFTIGPGESQLVRVFLRTAAADKPERSFRLLIDEIPAPGQQSAVHMTLRISIPLFAYGARPGRAALEWKLMNDDGAPALAVVNKGSRHAKLANLVITDETGARRDVPGARSAYVLPGMQRLWRLEGWTPAAPPAQAVTVSGLSDSGEISAQAPRVSQQ